MRLKIRQIEVFEALMEAGSVSRAAQRLNLTQPAVSVALSKLETALGFRLFMRSKGGFMPTSEALLLHAEAEQSLLAMARVERRVAEIRDGTAGSVTIASNGAAAINLLPRLIGDFTRGRKDVRVELRIHSSRQIAAWVSGRQIDIGLVDAPVPVADVRTELFGLRCVCIMPVDDPLTRHRLIRPEMLAGRSLVAITGQHGIDVQLDNLCAAGDVPIVRQVSGYFFAIVRNLVAAGAGIALVDPINGCLSEADGVTWRPFEPAIHYELALITPARGRAAPRASLRFLAALRDDLVSLSAPSRES